MVSFFFLVVVWLKHLVVSVRVAGVEPASFGVRSRCSTVELHSHTRVLRSCSLLYQIIGMVSNFMGGWPSRDSTVLLGHPMSQMKRMMREA